MPPVKRQAIQRRRTFFREWRLYRELKQYEAAERLEIEASTLSRLENGASPYNQNLLERLAAIYVCEPYELLETNPLTNDTIRIIYSKLRMAPDTIQQKALNIIEAFLKAS